MGKEQLRYADLEVESNRLARLLVDAGCRRGDGVCLLVSKSPYAVVSMLAVLKADCAYVPVDLESPAPRAARVIESADPAMLLVDSDGVKLAAELVVAGAVDAGRAFGLIDDSGTQGFDAAFRRSDWGAFSPEPRSYASGPNDLAHLLFTSGSTGLPKGVTITHSNVPHFVDWATSYFGFTASDRLSGHPPLHFELSTFDVYGCLCAGAELPKNQNGKIDRRSLREWFARSDRRRDMAAEAGRAG